MNEDIQDIKREVALLRMLCVILTAGLLLCAFASLKVKSEVAALKDAIEKPIR